VGGGNSAIDAARTALRCGANEVTILYRRTRAEMPAHHEEVDAAEKEGVKLELLLAPIEFISEDGRLKAVRCQRMDLGEPDASGRRKPVPVKGAVVDFPCDYVFAAIGQDTDLSVLQKEPEKLRPSASRWSTLESDPATMATNVKGVFAGGDVVLGPSAVIDAIAHGRVAAEAIDHYLRSGEVTKPKPEFKSRRDFFGSLPEWAFEHVERSQRCAMPEREVSERVRDFHQVETGLVEIQMKSEAFRCMECGCKSVFECDLKRYAAEYKVDISRVAGEVRRHRVDNSHPLITLDPNKCILCGRCIRTCSDIVGLAVLGFVGRGFATTVKPALGKSMAESPCISCGACVEGCPTGALEARLPHGRQGPWKTRKVPSVCSFCSIGCELDINVVSDGLLWATAPESSAAGRGELCMKGRFGTGLIQGNDRLTRPLVRKGRKLTEVGWDEAIEAAAGVLRGQARKNGRQSIAVMATPRMTLEEASLLRHLATVAIGTSEVGSFAQNRRGGPRHDLDDILGETASTCTLDDLAAADLILLAGADPGATHPVLGMAIRRAARRGAEIAAVNSSQPDLLSGGGLWLDSRRGTAGVIFAAVLNELTKSGLPKNAGLQQEDFDALRSSVAAISLSGAAMVSGVDAAKILSLVEKISGARRVVAVYDLDDTLERATDDLKGLAQALTLTGHIGNGQGLLLLQSDCNSEGARLAGILNPLHLKSIRSALVLCENPFGDYRAARELSHIESLVVVDHFLTETARMADVVLPAATFTESDGTVLSFDGRVIGFRRAGNPTAGLTTADILARLARALGRPVSTVDPAEIRAGVAPMLGIRASDLEQARTAGTQLPRKSEPACNLKPLRIDSTASVANIFPYASLDGVLEKKLAQLSAVSSQPSAKA
jgi:formate dehydrogenase major subunit